MNQAELVANLLLINFHFSHNTTDATVYRLLGDRWQWLEASSKLDAGQTPKVFLAVIVHAYVSGTVACELRAYSYGGIGGHLNEEQQIIDVGKDSDCSDLYRQIVDALESAGE